MGVAWTASAVADFEALIPDDREIDLVNRTLHEHSTTPKSGYIPVPIQEVGSRSFIIRAGRFAVLYQLSSEDMLIVAVQESLDVPLAVLICDEDEEARSSLETALRHEPYIEGVRSASTMEEARQLVRGANTIFIDPLSMGLEESTAFVLEVQLAFPEISVILYLDASIAERNRKEFFRGERSMFFQYRTLDKKTPAAIFDEELRAVLEACRKKLRWRRSEARVKMALQQAEELQSAETPSSPTVGTSLIQAAHEAVAELSHQASIARAKPSSRSVFVSYRFADKKLAEGLVQLLERNHFKVFKGDSLNTYVSQGVLERIKKCEFFLSLMTRDAEKKDGTYTTSSWVLEEKGAALALGKRPVLMVQAGVTEPGGLHGDWQLITFTLEDFIQAAYQAVDQLNSYCGDPSAPKP